MTATDTTDEGELTMTTDDRDDSEATTTAVGHEAVRRSPVARSGWTYTDVGLVQARSWLRARPITSSH